MYLDNSYLRLDSKARDRRLIFGCLAYILPKITFQAAFYSLSKSTFCGISFQPAQNAGGGKAFVLPSLCLTSAISFLGNAGGDLLLKIIRPPPEGWGGKRAGVARPIAQGQKPGSPPRGPVLMWLLRGPIRSR